MKASYVVGIVAVFSSCVVCYSHAEDITPNQAYCGLAAKARVDVVNLLCQGVSKAKLTKQVKDKYTSVQGDVLDDIVKSEAEHFKSDRCMDDPKSIFNKSFEACYSAISSLSGK